MKKENQLLLPQINKDQQPIWNLNRNQKNFPSFFFLSKTTYFNYDPDLARDPRSSRDRRQPGGALRGRRALPAPRRGSIDVFSGFGRGLQTGEELHKRVQAQRALSDSSYKSEVWISQKFERSGFLFEVSGRMDGLFDRHWKTSEQA